MQRIAREYYEKLYANRLDNLEEMHNFLEKYNLWRLTLEEIKKSEQTNYQQQSQIGNQKTPPKQNSKSRHLHNQIVPNI